MSSREKGKTRRPRTDAPITNLANIHFVWQKELRGLGDAVLYGRSFVGDEPFALLLGDTLLDTNDDMGRPVCKQLIDICEKYGQSVVALESVDPDKVERYGIVGGEAIGGGVLKLNCLIEKPKREEAPSNLAIAGRYVFQPVIFDYIADAKPGKNNEIQLTDAMARMMLDHGMYGLVFEGKRYDIGNKLDYLKTNIEFALRRDDVGPGLREYIKQIAAEL